MDLVADVARGARGPLVRRCKIVAERRPSGKTRLGVTVHIRRRAGFGTYMSLPEAGLYRKVGELCNQN